MTCLKVYYYIMENYTYLPYDMFKSVLLYLWPLFLNTRVEVELSQ